MQGHQAPDRQSNRWRCADETEDRVDVEEIRPEAAGGPPSPPARLGRGPGIRVGNGFVGPAADRPGRKDEGGPAQEVHGPQGPPIPGGIGPSGRRQQSGSRAEPGQEIRVQPTAGVRWHPQSGQGKMQQREEEDGHGQADGGEQQAFPGALRIGGHGQPERERDEQRVQHRQEGPPHVIAREAAKQPGHGHDGKRGHDAAHGGEPVGHQFGENDVPAGEIREEQQSERAVAAFAADGVGGQPEAGRDGENEGGPGEGAKQEVRGGQSLARGADENEDHQTGQHGGAGHTQANPERPAIPGGDDQFTGSNRGERHARAAFQRSAPGPARGVEAGCARWWWFIPGVLLGSIDPVSNVPMETGSAGEAHEKRWRGRDAIGKCPIPRAPRLKQSASRRRS